MPNTYTELLRTVLTSNTTAVTLSLSGISGYTDLRLVFDCATVADGKTLQITFNGDTTSLYSLTELNGNGTSATSTRTSGSAFLPVTQQIGTTTSLNRSFVTMDLQNYANTSVFKTVIGRMTNAGGASYPGTSAFVGLYRSTNAITSITITTNNSQQLSGATFSLYGIANADQGAAKATGGIITEDSQYWYHTFAASGTFTPKQSLTADILVVAGGAGPSSGAGGAGGIIYFASQSLTAANYTCTVGAGGAAQSSGALAGNNGVNSTFGALTAAVGGGGGGIAVASSNGLAGGSGGGGGSTDTANSLGGATNQTGTGATAFYGNAGGGNGNFRGAPYPNGGGGGAGAAGTSATSNTVAGLGGDGTTAFSSWGLATSTGQNVNGTVYYAGGGGGGAYQSGATPGTGGKGGGGAGAAGAVSTNGAANTGGGGGGGGGAAHPGAAGGSGIIIVRYAK